MEHDSRKQDNVVIKETDVCEIVLSYLIHNCFKETAESFIISTGIKQPSGYPMNMDERKTIVQFVVEGNPLKAVELTEKLAQGLFEVNQDLHFELLRLHFVDLVCSQKCTEALEFAQAKLAPFGKVTKYVAKLEDVMALLAYEEPEKSPTYLLVSPDYRQDVADSLNRAILDHAKIPRYSKMERLIQQAVVARHYLTQSTGKDGPAPFSLNDFLKS